MKVRNILKEMVPKVICRFVKHVTLKCIQSLGWIIINRMSWVFKDLEIYLSESIGKARQ